MQALVKVDVALLQSAERLRSIQGGGPLGATFLATLSARIPFINADAFVPARGLILAQQLRARSKVSGICLSVAIRSFANRCGLRHVSESL
jgi:hypothetical protein